MTAPSAILNLDRARAAFEQWTREYATTPKPDGCAKGGELLAALEACGVEAVTRSWWRQRETGVRVELLCFASGPEPLAAYRFGAENLWLPRTDFLARFAPVAG